MGSNYTLTSIAGLNPWAYSMFPGVAGSNVTFPSDSASIWNDTNLFRFDSDANRLLNGSTALCQSMIPAMEQWQARVAQIFQQIMANINSANTNINIPGLTSTTAVPGANTNIDMRTGKVKEDKIIDELRKMAAGDSTKDRMAKEINYKDREGNEHKTTLINRLTSLIKDYQENPDDAKMSKEDYERVWNIVTTYAKTGVLSTDDYKTLLEIAKKPDAGAKSDDDDDRVEDNDEIVSHKDNEKKKKEGIVKEHEAKTKGESGSVFKRNVREAVDYYKEGLIGWGTDYENLNRGGAAVEADNVIEIMDQYYKEVGINHGETLVDSIYADFDDWTDGIFTKGSASHFKILAEALIERAESDIEKYGETESLSNDVIEDFVSRFESINDDNYDSKKKEISNMFSDFVNSIKAAESKLLADAKKSSNN